MKDSNCGYCMRGELLDKFGIFICDLEVSSLILFKEQSKPGRVIVAYKDHVSEIVNISDEERMDEAIVYRSVSQFPARIKCATLAWKAIEEAIKKSEEE